MLTASGGPPKHRGCTFPVGTWQVLLSQAPEFPFGNFSETGLFLNVPGGYFSPKHRRCTSPRGTWLVLLLKGPESPWGGKYLAGAT